MKKILTIFAVMILLTGCTKNYNSVTEYANAMAKVKAGKSYTIEMKLDVNNKISHVKSFVKNDKWACELSNNNGNTYDNGLIKINDDIISTDKTNKLAIKMFNTKKLGKVADFVNPAYTLINWDQNFQDETKPVKGEFTNNKAKMNNFDCRMIKFDDGREACISDKYGIAVYQRIDMPNPKTKQIEENTFNVISIDTTELADSTFEIPSDYKLMSFETLLQDLTKAFGKLK